MKKEGVLQIPGGADIILFALSGLLLLDLAGGREHQEHDEGNHDGEQEYYIPIFAMHKPTKAQEQAALTLITKPNTLTPNLTHLLHVLHIIRNHLSNCFSHWPFIRALSQHFRSYEFHVALI